MIPARRWLPVALLVLLVGGSALVQLQQRIDAASGSLHRQADVLYVPSGEWVKKMSLGYDGLAAALYWTRVVQYYGRHHSEKGSSYALLYPLLDITTTLDPQLLIAYKFGALFLSEPPPDGPGQPDQAVTLLEKGIRANPDEWRLWYSLGFVYYQGLRDYQKASQSFLEGSKNPNAYSWMGMMAAQVANEGGSRQTAKRLWTEMYNSAQDEHTRTAAARHLAGLKADEDIEQLQALVEKFRQQTGQPARSLRDLIHAGLLPGVPVDPAGFPYRLAPSGRVLLHPRSPLLTASLLGRER